MKGKKFLAIVGIFSLAALSFGLAAIGATSADVTATVTPQVVSVSVSDGAVNYGILNFSETNNTFNGTAPALGDDQLITNGSNVPINIQVKSSDATGSSITWELGAAPGSNIFGHQYDIDTGAGPATWLDFPASNDYSGTAVNLTETGGIDPSATMDLKLLMPTGSADTSTHGVTITVLATES